MKKNAKIYYSLGLLVGLIVVIAVILAAPSKIATDSPAESDTPTWIAEFEASSLCQKYGCERNPYQSDETVWIGELGETGVSDATNGTNIYYEDEEFTTLFQNLYVEQDFYNVPGSFTDQDLEMLGDWYEYFFTDGRRTEFEEFILSNLPTEMDVERYYFDSQIDDVSFKIHMWFYPNGVRFEAAPICDVEDFEEQRYCFTG